MKGLEPYPVSRDSGVLWLGQLPAHWSVLPLRALLTEVDQRDHPDEQMLSVTITRGVIPQSTFLEDSSKKDASRLDKSAYKLVVPGDLAYNKMRAWQGAFGVSRHRGIVSPAYVVERPGAGADPSFIHYLLRTPAFANEAERWSYGIASDMWSLRPEHFRMIYACVPPIGEQAAIVLFLGHADRRIRRYIAAKKKLIGLLNEQKQAVIHRAVTRGLDPAVRLKASGIDWLGDMPEHWRVTPLNAASSSIQTGPFGSQLHAGEYVMGGTPVINPSHLRDGVIHADVRTSVSQQRAEDLARHQLKFGDVVMARRGELGRCAQVTKEQEGWLCGTGSLRIRPRLDAYEPSYLVELLGSSGVRQALIMSSVGATMDNLNASMVARLRLPVPPLLEQGVIMERVSAVSADTRSAVGQIQSEIDLIREYRTRLISDVVTGKLDVREASALLPDEVEEAELLDDTDVLAQGDESEVDLDAALDEVVA